MEAIVNEANWPKFLRVNDTMTNNNVNKYLLKPWKKGEIVRVLPYNEQVSPTEMRTELFRMRYVRVVRKDETGAWALNYTWNWGIFENLKN